MSLRTQYFTGRCRTGKRSYINRTSAKDAANMGKKSGLGHMRAYRCDDCHGWHIGHIPRRIMTGSG